MKTKDDKRVNKVIRDFNQSLKNDVFGCRFYARQVAKCRCDDLNYYMYELIDNEQSERNKLLGWFWTGEIINSKKVHIAMNNFIVASDFWAKYWEKHLM